MIMSFFAWNVRGFNDPRKHNAVRDWLRSTSSTLLFGCLLETRVLVDSYESIATYVFPGWNKVANYDYHRLGRIWFLWSSSVQVNTLYKGPQIMTFAVTTLTGDRFLISTVYASNFANDRKVLWDEICHNKTLFDGVATPWIIIGDFNDTLTSSEHSSGRIGSYTSMADFQNMISICALSDLRYEGPKLTWWNNRKQDPIGKKLDRSLVNDAWLQQFPSSYTSFETNGISDHVRSTTHLRDIQIRKRTPFRFFNFLTNDEMFLSETKRIWDMSPPLYHSRTALARFTGKMKQLKPMLRELNKHRYGSISYKTKQAFEGLCAAQNAALLQPTTSSFAAVEEATKEWNRLASAEEQFFKQKSRISWLEHGDSNTAFFHNSVKNRTSRNKIHQLTSSTGVILTEPRQIKSEAINHFSTFMQQSEAVSLDEATLSSVIKYRCPIASAQALVAPITGQEIKEVLYKLPLNKATGPDGFTVEFYRAAWNVVGHDLVVAVQSYFHFLFMPRGTNATLLALIPKKDPPENIKDFRPISCCNVIYKIISKILANRLKEILPEAIEPNQSAFIKGRLLLENVLLATELVTGYHRTSTTTRCAIKVDVAKAFDTLRWDFILAVLHAMQLPEIFVKWIQGCITTAAFSVTINGETEGFFTSSRGIRQGCSLSPYLYDIANNVLTLMLNRAAECGKFGYHVKCDEVKLTHLSFADDMLIFTDGTPSSLQGVMQVLEEYKLLSGLAINPAKSSIFLGGQIRTDTLDWILHNGFQLENLPIRYLGLPLTTKSMTRTDYEPLIDRIRTRFQSWTNRTLSYSGRLQLIKSVITSIANFWCSVFRLPQRCLDQIESMCAAFLWSGSPTITSKAKVAWEDLCLPKIEGGLGIRRLRDTSIAYSLSLIWRLLTSSGSYWVVWTKHYLLRHSSFWDIKRNTRGSWIWNKLLKLRPIALSFIRYNIGNGRDTFFWIDNWLGTGPLIQTVGEVGPSLLGIARLARVADVVRDGGWNLRYRRNPLVRDQVSHILTLPAPLPTDIPDRVLWRYDAESYKDSFSLKITWETLRRRAGKKDWSKLTWSPLSLPRYSFITWLAFLDRLSTGARAVRWGQNPMCPLCGDPWETRDHLFFACPYAYAVWSQLSEGVLSTDLSPSWSLTVASLLRNRRSKEINILSRFLFQATIYHVWRERNGRQHGTTQTPAAIIARTIKDLLTQRLKARYPNQDALQKAKLWTTWRSIQ